MRKKYVVWNEPWVNIPLPAGSPSRIKTLGCLTMATVEDVLERQLYIHPGYWTDPKYEGLDRNQIALENFMITHWAWFEERND